MKNTLLDLNNHLFAQLERLGNENITKDELALEVERTKALTSVSTQVVGNARLALDAAKFQSGCEGLPKGQNMPGMLVNQEPRTLEG